MYLSFYLYFFILHDDVIGESTCESVQINNLRGPILLID